MNLKYEYLAVGRSHSIFEADLTKNYAELQDKIQGNRIVIVGAAGSIGSAVVRTLLKFNPAALSLIDLSENNLVELVRELRSGDVCLPEDFSTMPIGLGSVEFTRYMAREKKFDYFFNLSAIKHVRSERNIYCLARMMDTNVLFLSDFLQNVPYTFRKVFSVSSDKAANPANLMGASKMIMEKVLLNASEKQPFSSARFANVAFSDGSLPHGFLERINKIQPLSAPNDVRRYFISHQEAGELCVISAILGENRDVLFPKFKEQLDEKTFAEIAVLLLAELGYEPVLCSSEDEAKARMKELVAKKKWPCYFFKSDTSGEKASEEFYLAEEKLDLERFQQIGVIKRDSFSESGQLRDFLKFCTRAKNEDNISKEDYVKEVLKIIPTLHHVETGRNLDQKM